MTLAPDNAVQEIEIDDGLPNDRFAYIDTASSGPGRPPGCAPFTSRNAVLPFYLHGATIRGKLVRLDALAQEILGRHHYPDSVLALCGKAAALTSALASSLKFDGLFTLQIQGDGAVRMLTSDCSSDGSVRAMAQIDEKKTDWADKTDVELLGKGHMAVTVQNRLSSQPHQAIVPLDGHSLAEIAEGYFKTSEQHGCKILLFAKRYESGWNAGALILERLPATDEQKAAIKENVEDSAQDGIAVDVWDTAVTFADTLKEDELFNQELSLETLANRLFGTLDVRVSEPRNLTFGCRCTRSRFEDMLGTFPKDDIEHMTQKDGTISIDCAFCEVRFLFDPKAFLGDDSKEALKDDSK